MKNNFDFFIADNFRIFNFRNEISSMEHPFFALKNGETKVRKYFYGNIHITIKPPIKIGMATIFDKDIWIYSISKLQFAINNSLKKINKTICFTPYDFFKSTSRNKGGRSYIELKNSLNRLSGTRICTNINYLNKIKTTTEFGLIDSWSYVEYSKFNKKNKLILINLPEWLYESILNTNIIKINKNYFNIKSAIYRRIYEIARKHCGNKNKFLISISNLYKKSGSRSKISKFIYLIKKLIFFNNLPDYSIKYDSKNKIVSFFKKLHI